MRITRKTNTSSATTSRRFRRTALAGLVGVAALAGVAGTATAADAETCIGKEVHVQYDNQVVHGTCGGDLVFIGNHKNVKVYTYDGNDDIRGGWYNATSIVYAGNGNDTITASESGAQIYGEAGNDTLKGSYGSDYLNGGSGEDKIYGGKGADVLYGEAGNDTMISDDYGVDAKKDHVLGGTGFDTAKHEAYDTVYADVEVKQLLP